MNCNTIIRNINNLPDLVEIWHESLKGSYYAFYYKEGKIKGIRTSEDLNDLKIRMENYKVSGLNKLPLNYDELIIQALKFVKSLESCKLIETINLNQ